MQFEKDLQRCSKLMEELDSVIAKKKDASQQVVEALSTTSCVILGMPHRLTNPGTGNDE
jgi:hypothetical protein